MIVYHVCSLKMLNKYRTTGYIKPPVRAWDNVDQAVRMSISTGRRCILRLKFPDNAEVLEGHFGQARIMHTQISTKDV